MSPNILEEILAHKRLEVAAAKVRLPADRLAESARATTDPPRGFRAALQGAASPAVIAELKRRSPSKGEIRPDFEPVACARAYCEGGAAALSVLTDEHYFGGHLDYLTAVRAEVDLPLLRKDFVVDAYQIDQARVAGADAVLLIVSALREDELTQLATHAHSLGLDVLVEVKNESELEIALESDADLLGVNNRDLTTFEVDLGRTGRLAAAIPRERDVLLVAESGIFTPADIEVLTKAGAGAFLVGESLMRQRNLAEALRSLRGQSASQPETEAGSESTSGQSEAQAVTQPGTQAGNQ